MNKSVHSCSLLMFMLILVLIASFFSVPAFAWYGPPYDGAVGTEDGCFEMSGPRIDNVLIKMYAGTKAEWEALKAGEIDITDWTLTKAYYDEFMSGTYPDIAVADSGGELNMYVFDMNNHAYTNDDSDLYIGPPDMDDTPNPFGDETFIVLGHEHPYTPGANVTRGSQARLALAHLIDRDAIIEAAGMQVSGYTYNPMYTHIPESPVFRIGGWINDNVYKYPYDPSIAAQILDMAGYLDNDGNGWREDPQNPDVDLTLEFYTRLDAFRAALGDWVQNALTLTLPTIGPTYAGIKVNRHPVTGGGAWKACMLMKTHNLYTAGWILCRQPPSCYYPLYHSDFWWPHGDPPNYNWVRDSEIDRLSELAYYAPDTATAKQAILDIQTRMNQPDAVFNIPIANTICRKAFKKTYTNTGTYWRGLINSAGYGINTGPSPGIDSFLNAHPDGMETGGTIKYGWKYDTMPSSLNPFQYSWFWDSEVIFRIYNMLLATNPYDPFGGGPGGYPGDLPWMAKSWEIGTWSPDGGVTINSKFTFSLRNDVYFHDGTPMTAEDVWYTIKFGFYQAEDHPEYGWESLPPWFWGNIMNIDITKPDEEVMPDGPLGYTIVLYYKVREIWSFWWAGTGIPIVPKEKWWDKFYPDPTGSDGFAPDPQLIGTGPFKIFPGKVDGTDPEHYTPCSHIKLDKNPTFFNSYRHTTANLDVHPEALNLMSKGRWVTAYIELPGDYNVNHIDVTSIMLNDTIPVDMSAPAMIGDYDKDAVPDLMVKFIRADVKLFIVNESEILERFTLVTLTIRGKLKDGTSFGGSCTIKVTCMIQRRPERGIFPI